jgi:hypothetical protein
VVPWKAPSKKCHGLDLSTSKLTAYLGTFTLGGFLCLHIGILFDVVLEKKGYPCHKK